MSLFGRNSVGTSFENGRLLVIVTPNKQRLLEDRTDEIAKTAKSLFGSEVYVVFRSGEITRSGAAEGPAAMSEAEASKIIDEDINTNEVIEDIQNLFGISPVMED